MFLVVLIPKFRYNNGEMNKIKTSLFIDERIIKRAKQCAKKQKMSFEAWVASLMKRAMENSNNKDSK